MPLVFIKKKHLSTYTPTGTSTWRTSSPAPTLTPARHTQRAWPRRGVEQPLLRRWRERCQWCHPPVCWHSWGRRSSGSSIRDSCLLVSKFCRSGCRCIFVATYLELIVVKVRLLFDHMDYFIWWQWKFVKHKTLCQQPGTHCWEAPCCCHCCGDGIQNNGRCRPVRIPRSHLIVCMLHPGNSAPATFSCRTGRII